MERRWRIMRRKNGRRVGVTIPWLIQDVLIDRADMPADERALMYREAAEACSLSVRRRLGKAQGTIC
jgi:hypothetical protein